MVPFMIEGKVFAVNDDGEFFQHVSGILNRETNMIACSTSFSFDDEKLANKFFFVFDDAHIECSKDGSAFFKITDVESLNTWVVNNTHEPYYISNGIKMILKFMRII